MQLTRVMSVLAGVLVACNTETEPTEALSSEAQHVDYKNEGVCRGTCYPETIYVTAMSGEKLPFTSYRCVDYEFTKVSPDSHTTSTIECNKVAQCIADGTCRLPPAILPQNQALASGSGLTSATDAAGTKWLRAKWEFTNPKQYFLAPKWFDKQQLSTYTATQPPTSASVAAALGGLQPCPIPTERIHGTATCAAREPNEVCDLRVPDPSGLISDTESCVDDPQLDSPRQWLHITGSYPENAPEGQWNYDLDGTSSSSSASSCRGCADPAVV